MPFIPDTPESLLERSDSKDPASTCQGVTANGRLCRRSLATSARSRPALEITWQNDDAVFYCWQHKDQALIRRERDDQRDKQSREHALVGRSSVDTLVDRLGILQIKPFVHADGLTEKAVGAGGKLGARRRRSESRSRERSSSKPRKHIASGSYPKPRPHVRQSGPRSGGLLSFFCCVAGAPTEEDALEPPKRRDVRRHDESRRHGRGNDFAGKPQRRPVTPEITAVKTNPTTATTTLRKAHVATEKSTPRTQPSPLPTHPTQLPDPRSQTEALLSTIPKTLSPQTVSVLLAELAKPLPPTDDQGYIYIFCLTTPETGPSVSDTASTILDSPGAVPAGRRSNEAHAASRILDDLAVRTGDVHRPRSLLLKIGRASNVQRRMNEWTRQCGYNLSLVRWYPYGGPSSTGSPSPLSSKDPVIAVMPAQTKVRYVRRVERLIHIELADKRVKRACGVCGQEHREWFAVEASREAVAEVDRVVRRWVAWAEGAERDDNF